MQCKRWIQFPMCQLNIVDARTLVACNTSFVDLRFPLRIRTNDPAKGPGSSTLLHSFFFITRPKSLLSGQTPLNPLSVTAYQNCVWILATRLRASRGLDEDASTHRDLRSTSFYTARKGQSFAAHPVSHPR